MWVDTSFTKMGPALNLFFFFDLILQFVDYGDEDDEGELPLMIPLTTARYGKTCKVEDYNGPDEATTDSQEGGHSQSEVRSPLAWNGIF